jgi:hypothetical protein
MVVRTLSFCHIYGRIVCNMTETPLPETDPLPTPEPTPDPNPPRPPLPLPKEDRTWEPEDDEGAGR